MTSKERVMTAFAHSEPDRVPTWCGASVEFWEKAKQELGKGDEELRVFFGDDFRKLVAHYAGPEEPLAPGASFRTVFGIERTGLGYGQPTTHPLAEATLDEIHAYPWPTTDRADIDGIRAEAESYNGKYAILGGAWSPFWHDAIDMMGMESLYMRMFDEPEAVDALMKHMVDYYFDLSRLIFDATADVTDIFFIGNDLGSQTGPLLGVDLFERFVQPHLKRLVDLGHDYGLKVMLHCCGGIAPLIPNLIEIEMDAIHAVQTTCRGMDLTELKRNFGDKMVFNGGIDSHHILIDGTPDYVRQKTREILDIMKPGGGYIAGASHDTILEETPVENIVAMFDAIKEFGRY